jgi:hypothetical protein
MATYEILKEIVSSGCNLILYKSISYDVMRELAEIAKRTGAKLTFTTTMSNEVIRELCVIGGNNITFINDLGALIKDPK